MSRGRIVAPLALAAVLCAVAVAAAEGTVNGGARRHGWRVESHTLTHPNLTTLDPRMLRREVGRSRSIMRRLFHQRVDFFCYPGGAFDRAVVAAVRRAGYLGAETELPGLAGPWQRFTLRRVRVAGGESIGDYMASLRTG